MGKPERGRGRPPTKGRGDPSEAEKAKMRAKAEQLTKSGMPFQMALAVAQGRMDLNDALERLARRAEVEQLMRKHDLNRALATQISMGHADLEAFLAKRRLDAHREEHRERSVLDESQASGTAFTFGLHGHRTLTAAVEASDAYEVTLSAEGAEPEVVHKLQFKYAYAPADWKRAKKAMKKDKAVWDAPREPIERPQDRYTISDKRLFRYMDQARIIDVTLLEGEVFRGAVSWFGRYEFGLEVKGGATVTIFRHALHAVASA